MSSDDGDGNFIKKAVGSATKSFTNKKGNFFENMLDGGLNATLQIASGGLVGMQDGKIGGGITGSEVIKGYKEVSGVKAAEDANTMAREQYEEQKRAAELQRKNEQIALGREQMRQSNMAGAARTSSKSNNTRSAARTSNSLGAGAEKDFLGL